MTVPTLKQYASMRWNDLRSDYGITLKEAMTCFPMESLKSEWFTDVLIRIGVNGNVPSWQLWRSLTSRQQFEVLRTELPLRDSSFARRLVLLGNLSKKTLKPTE